MSTLSAGILLFLIMDPLGNIPLFLSLLRNVDPARRRLRAGPITSSTEAPSRTPGSRRSSPGRTSSAS